MTILTEAQARAKWCPHAIASHTDPRRRDYVEGDVERSHNTGQFHFNCLGSECMAWRFVPSDAAVRFHFSQRHRARLPPAETQAEQAEPMGYCGLAGAPQ